MPRGWGVSYAMWVSDHTVIHPLPLNYIVAFARWLMHKIKIPPFSDYSRAIELEAFNKGHEKGYEKGRQECVHDYCVDLAMRNLFEHCQKLEKDWGEDLADGLAKKLEEELDK